MIEKLTIDTKGQGLHEITDKISALVKKHSLNQGIVNILVQHTSASLIIQENADPSARHDLEQFLNNLVLENNPLYTHTIEGADDMPSHIKSVLTATTLSIPIISGRLALGTWQGIYLWEHRKRPHRRSLVVYLGL